MQSKMAHIGTTTLFQGSDAMDALFPIAPPSPASVLQAANRLKGLVHRTPILRSTAADEKYNAQFFFKCENLQRTGSFKFRGAFNT